MRNGVPHDRAMIVAMRGFDAGVPMPNRCASIRRAMDIKPLDVVVSAKTNRVRVEFCRVRSVNTVLWRESARGTKFLRLISQMLWCQRSVAASQAPMKSA